MYVWKYQSAPTGGETPLKVKTGNTHSGSATKANILNDQFPSVFNIDEDQSTVPGMGPSPHPTVDNITVTQNGVHNLLAGLEPHNASGPDQPQADCWRN